MPTTQSKIPKKTLEAAAKLLQGAHDYIEQFGFDIDTYDGKRCGQKGGHGAPMCYIGTLRHVAGINPSPAKSNGVAAAGDGDELIVALKAMDKIAKRRMRAYDRKSVMVEYGQYGHEEAPEFDADFHTIGRFVERLGFDIQERAYEKFDDDNMPLDDLVDKAHDYERDYALRLLRRALTDLYR